VSLSIVVNREWISGGEGGMVLRNVDISAIPLDWVLDGVFYLHYIVPFENTL
jgi:hypothetical protein